MFLPPFLYMSLGIYVKFVAVSQKYTYWVLRYTDVQLYTIWLTCWGPNEVTVATCPSWECGQDVLKDSHGGVCGGNWATTLCTWQGTYRIDHGALRVVRQGRKPPQSHAFQGVSPLAGKRRTWQTKAGRQGFSPNWQYLHLGLRRLCIFSVSGEEGAQWYWIPPHILPQWSLPIAFISLCICTLLKFSQLERATIISTDEVWRRKSCPKVHHLGQMPEQIISPS